MRLLQIKKISGIILLQSGLHIGAGKDSVEIGGLDQPVIRNPITNAPYIPGSSLKGKMRSLLESRLQGEQPETRKNLEKGVPCKCGKKSCPVCVIFGVSGAEDTDIGPTRILVRDALLTQKDRELFESGNLPMEIKYENTINRCKGVAEHPRPLERVPAGVSFDLNIGFRVYENDPPDLLDWVYKALRLVELDALGGCGSRGCGEVSFQNLREDGNEKVKYENLNSINVF